MKKELIDVINRLKHNIEIVPTKFLKFSEDELKRKSTPAKWFKKEILGHLIDSAANNHQRFVRAQYEDEPFIVISYDQDDWVNIQNYNTIDTKFIVELWKMLNLHILNILNNFPEDKLLTKCKSNVDEEIVDNVFLLMKDYVDHMDHHLNQIFDKE